MRLYRWHRFQLYTAMTSVLIIISCSAVEAELDYRQEIIFNNDESYLQRILDAGFHGVCLDIIDAFEYWEQWARSGKA